MRDFYNKWTIKGELSPYVEGLKNHFKRKKMRICWFSFLFFVVVDVVFVSLFPILLDSKEPEQKFEK